MPPSATDSICLPLALLAKLKSERTIDFKSSHVFQPEFQALRSQLLQLDIDAHKLLEKEIVREDTSPLVKLLTVPGITGRTMEDMHCFREGDGKTFLHLAIRDGDIPLAYEIIRMGIGIDYPDTAGVTPLFYALEHISTLSRMFHTLGAPAAGTLLERSQTSPPACAPEPGSARSLFHSIVLIATLLIEQHADVNHRAFGVAPVALAIEAKHWDLITLLLRHGADGIATAQKAVDGIMNEDDKARLNTLMHDEYTLRSRPQRPCPCWSGELLSECHDTGFKLPYPDHFLCVCGENRSYGECCKKKRIVVKEEWDYRNDRICRADLRPRLPRVIQGLQRDLKTGYRVGYWLISNISTEMLKRLSDNEVKRGEALMQLVSKYGRVKDIDPAFKYALYHTNMNPGPWADTISTSDGQKYMDVWNAAVDKYIDNVGDDRPRFAIELAAKISSDGGPLYKFCEAAGCCKLEGQEVKKLKGCVACKAAFYCSVKCQKAGWPSHKRYCQSSVHRYAQTLVSQNAIEAAIARFHVDQGMSWREYDLVDPQAFLDDLELEEIAGFVEQMGTELLTTSTNPYDACSQ